MMKVSVQPKLTRQERLDLKRQEAQAKRDEEKKQAEADRRLTPAELQTKIDELRQQISALELKRPRKRTAITQSIVNTGKDEPSVFSTRQLVLSPAEEARTKEINAEIHKLEQRISYFKDLQDPSRVEARKKKPKRRPSIPGLSSARRADDNFMKRMARK